MSADTHGGTHFFAQIQTRSIVRAILADFARWNVKILLNSARLHRRKRGDPTPHQTRIFTLFRTLFQRIQRSKRGWHETPPLTIKGETPDTISGTSLPAKPQPRHFRRTWNRKFFFTPCPNYQKTRAGRRSCTEQKRLRNAHGPERCVHTTRTNCSTTERELSRRTGPFMLRMLDHWRTGPRVKREWARTVRERASERTKRRARETKRERVHPLVREWTHANSMNDMNMCAPTASSHMWANTCALMAVVVAGFVLVHFWERQAKKWERGERASDLPCEWNMWSTDCTQRPEPGPGDLWVGLMLGGKGTVMLCGVKWWRRQAVSSGNWFLDFFETAYNIHLHHFV